MAESQDSGSASTPPPTGDDNSARMLREVQGLRQDVVATLEAGLSSVPGLEGIRVALEHGFINNAKVLEGFREAFRRPPIVLNAEDTKIMQDIAAASKQLDYRNLQLPLPSALDVERASTGQNAYQFPDTSGAVIEEASSQ